MVRPTVIYKYSLSVGTNVITLPKYHNPFFAGAQADGLKIWVEIDPNEKETEEVTFYVFATGEKFDREGLWYISTIQDNGFVWHVYEKMGE